jgi:hypothetical protein
MCCGIEHILGNHCINTMDQLRVFTNFSFWFGITPAQNVAPAAYCGGSKFKDSNFTFTVQSKKKTNKVDKTRLISDGRIVLFSNRSILG